MSHVNVGSVCHAVQLSASACPHLWRICDVISSVLTWSRLFYMSQFQTLQQQVSCSRYSISMHTERLNMHAQSVTWSTLRGLIEGSKLISMPLFCSDFERLLFAMTYNLHQQRKRKEPLEEYLREIMDFVYKKAGVLQEAGV